SDTQGVILKDVVLSIGKGAITTDKLADGAVTTEKIEAGKDGQVLVTVIEKDAEGKDVPTTKWVSKVDATTNTLAKKEGTNGNTIVSTVNGVPAEIALVDKVENKVNGTTITTVVNGVESTSVDLTSAIEAGQKTTSVKNGSDKVTVVTTGAGTKGKNTEYTVDVDEAKLSLQNIGGQVTNNQIQGGKEGDVLVSTTDDKGNSITKWVTKAGATTNELKLDGNKLTSTVNGKDAFVELTADNVASTKGITGTGITVTGGANATLKDVTLAITPGKENQVMVTSKEGNATWVDQNALTNITLGGDVTGNADNTTISKLQGKDLVTTNVAEGNVLVFDGDKWVNKTPSVDASNVGNGKALSSTENTITISANGATSLLKDVQIDVADNAITSDKIKDGAVTTDKITGGDNGQVLTTTVSTEGKKTVEWKTPTVNTTDITNKGNLTSATEELLTVKDGTGVVLQNVSLAVNEGNFNISNMKGDLTINRIEGGKPNQVLVTEGDKVTWVDNKTFVQANQEKVVVKPADGKATETNSNVIVTPTTGKNGEKEYTVDVKAAMPKVFYMPPVMFDTSKKHNVLQTRNLYDEYVAMFGGKGAVVDTPISGDRPPMVQSDASATIPVYKKEDLNFFVPYYDPAVFSDVEVDVNGVLTYKVIKKAKYGAFMTVVFVVK
ncbi:hypothetical protein ACKLNQ_16910, partial [Myroides odoratimimus]|uniref:hypothetical protein n=1 Tax=Myroides odoratimimus TaxID=76832 RepID=UPI0038D40528